MSGSCREQFITRAKRTVRTILLRRFGSTRIILRHPSARGLILAMLLPLIVSACLPSQWEYLVEANGRATEDDVRNRFGVPVSIKTFEDQSANWTYRYEVKTSWLGRRGDMVGGAPCIEYELTFDQQEVLAHWVRRPCERTGEKLGPM